jgi:hypothetical protein
VLLGVHLVVDHLFAPRTAATTLQYLSTNLDNLHHHPVPSILGSALIIDSTLTHPFTISFGGTLITLVAGIAITLSALERRLGGPRAFAVFFTGHIVATLLVAPVIADAIANGWYPQALRTAHDVGISYGAEAVLACATFALLRKPIVRAVWAAGVVAWPLADMQWMRYLPDFTTIGHLTAAFIGFAAGLLLHRSGRSAPAGARQPLTARLDP